MAHPSFSHDENSCPAFSYCKAIESLGLSIPLGRTCFFDVVDDSVAICDATTASIESLDAKSLPRLLFEAAHAELESFMASSAVEPARSLANLFDAKLEAYIRLWKAMVEAGRSGRQLTDVELGYYENEITAASRALEAALESSSPSLAACAQTAHDRACLEAYDLIFDDEMISDVNRIVGNVMNARPTLVVGDKGIAKTQVAKFVMSLYGLDPIVISVKGDMMSDELIGKLKHDRELGTFVFEEGALLGAMREGLPVLLDEMNFGDQSIIARLQDILLKKPGETVFVQESGAQITIAPGFAVLATANEASTRYRHREILDPAIRDRFDIVIRTYPDLDIEPLVDTPPKLLRLALASISDPWGFPSKHIDLRTLVSFVRLAHATEHLYAIPGKNASVDFSGETATGSITEDDEPLMTDCLTPRTVAKTLGNCALGNLPGESLGVPLIERLLKSLDQANSSNNYELAAQVASLMDIELTVAESKRRVAPTHAIPRDGLPYDDLPERVVQALVSR